MFKQFFTIAILAASSLGLIAAKPNIVLVMADDQGWGQTGFEIIPRSRLPTSMRWLRMASALNGFMLEARCVPPPAPRS